MTEKLEAMAEAADPSQVMLKRKAIGALFPYALRLQRRGHKDTADSEVFPPTTHGATNSERFVWLCIKLNRIVALASPPDAPWGDGSYDGGAVTKWALAASAIPYTEEIGRSVVDVLLHAASIGSIPSHTPTGVWALLEKRPSLPSRRLGWPGATNGDVVRRVRRFGDIEVLEAYLHLVWSEWDCVEGSERDSVGSRSGLAEMQISIREDFGGVRVGHHREELINRLDYVLAQLDRGLEYLGQHKPGIDEGYIQTAKEQYEGLRKVLLEVDGEVANILASKSPRLILFGLLTHGNTCRIPLDLHVRSTAPVSIISRFKNMSLLSPTIYPVCTPIPIVVVVKICTNTVCAPSPALQYLLFSLYDLYLCTLSSFYSLRRTYSFFPCPLSFTCLPLM